MMLQSELAVTNIRIIITAKKNGVVASYKLRKIEYGILNADSKIVLTHVGLLHLGVICLISLRLVYAWTRVSHFPFNIVLLLNLFIQVIYTVKVNVTHM